MRLSELKKKKVLILGFGREGRDTFLFLRKIFPKKVLGVGDKKEFSIFNFQFSNLIKKDKKVRWHLGKNYLKALKNYEIIIKSPGISAKELRRSDLRKSERKITSQTEIFFQNCPGKIIGVTGTKGKGITAKLIYEMLREKGLKANLVGNIGKPALSYLLGAKPNDIFVYELSSHQLQNLKVSPEIAVLLNVFPDHLDYFQNFKEYIRAKENIAKYQSRGDYLIFNSDDKLVRKIAKKSKAKKIPIPTNYEFKRIANKKNLNPQNVAAAYAVGKLFGISKAKLKKVVKKFKAMPHRLEFVGSYQGIEFYNDSASTIPESTISGLDILGNKVQTLILGGSEKKLSFKKLAQRILKSETKTLILFPTTGRRIWQEITKNQRCRVSLRMIFVDNMREAVRLAYQNTKSGKICLLSPASASFGIFKDYQERGNLFKKFVKSLTRKLH